MKLIYKILIAIVILAVIFVIGAFTTYKNEELVCKFKEDACSINRYNLFNMQSSKFVAKYSDIDKCGHYLIRVKGNRYAKGYSSYLLTFELKNDKEVEVFKEPYYEKEELQNISKNILTQLRKNEDFTIKR